MRSLWFGMGLLALATPSLAGPPARIAPSLRMWARQVRSSAEKVEISVRLDENSDLEALGFAVRPGAGAIRYLTVSAEELARLVALPSVRAVEPLRRLTPSLDRSVPLTFAPVARAEFGLDGTGAIVGVVDTGCDFRHADLRATDGTTRLAALLDMSHPRDGRHPELPNYNGGKVWLRGEIDAQLVADAAQMTPAVVVDQRDIDGHGTHVTGIAAGNGRGTGRQLPAGRYVGMAPGAAIIAVDAARDGHSFAEDDVVAGTRFVFERAAALGLPAVVNLSLSGEGGPHDGTSNFEQALEALLPASAVGRALVVAAGNGGSRDTHAGGNGLAGTIELALPFPDSASVGEAIDLDLWFSGPPPSLTLVAPDGHSFGPVAAGAKLDSASMNTEGAIAIENATGGVDPINGRWEAGVSLRGSDGKAPAGGTWKLVLDGRAERWDAWMIGVPEGAIEPRFADHLDADGRAQLPAFTPSVIAVGSFASKNAWTTRDGLAVTRSLTLGRSSTFTGTGPTSDGRFLPDLAAPGDFITSTLSSDAPPEICHPDCAPNPASTFFVSGAPAYLWADDGVHGILRGTSQAAPHVAGAAALLFQLDPTLTPVRMRELLRASAALAPGEPGFSTREGFGRLDVAAAARLLARRPTGPADPLRSTVGTSLDAVAPGSSMSVRVSVVPRDAGGAPIGPGHAVTVEGWDDRSSVRATFSGPVRDGGEGRYERALTASGPTGAALAIHVTVDGVVLAAHPIVWLAARREDIGRPYSAVGGCGVGGVGGASSTLAFVLAFGGLALLWRRAKAVRAAAPAESGAPDR